MAKHQSLFFRNSGKTLQALNVHVPSRSDFQHRETYSFRGFFHRNNLHGKLHLTDFSTNASNLAYPEPRGLHPTLKLQDVCAVERMNSFVKYHEVKAGAAKVL